MAERLIGCWPHAKPPDGKTYAAAIAATLASYPLQVAKECADPRTGLPREREFPPTVAAVVEWCDRRKSGYEAAASVKDWQIESMRRRELPEPEYSEEHCAAMRERIASIPKVHFQRMPGSGVDA